MTVKEMKEASDHLEQFLSIIKKCDQNAYRSLQVHSAVDRHTACYRLLYQEEEEEEEASV
jgi:hypothetical protein